MIARIRLKRRLRMLRLYLSFRAMERQIAMIKEANAA